MTELRGEQFLKRKLVTKRQYVKKRYDFYDMKNYVRDLQISTPPQLRNWTSSLGWCGKAVDCIADRMIFNEFKNDTFGLNEIYQMNNVDILIDDAVKGALISSCDFIYICPDEDGYPKMQVIDGGNATGEIDQITGFLKEGYAVLERDNETDMPIIEAYFLPHLTTYRNCKTGEVINYEHRVNYPLLVPVRYKPDAVKPFGHSRITPACMDYQIRACMTIRRSEISSEFYSFPQKYVSGLADDAEQMDKWKASMSALLTFTKDSEGDHPIIGQFQQQTMTPHLDMLKQFAAMFAGESGLTLDDLGFVTCNPSSAEAIKASHESLRLTARKAQQYFSTAFINAGMLAACLRDDFDYKRGVFYETKCQWAPVFATDVSQLGVVGDALMKLQQSYPDYMTEDKFYELTGI